jgi:hypothetical protein
MMVVAKSPLHSLTLSDADRMTCDITGLSATTDA